MGNKKHRRRNILLIIFGSLLIILIAFRIALPYILLKFVNKDLQTIPGYTGHVDDIDVHLIRGAYTIKTIKLDKTGGKIPVPFFSAEIIDLSLEWSAIFHGRIVGKIIVRHPVINFAKGPTEETSQTEIPTKPWTKVVGDLMPLKLNRFEIFDGEIHYRDFYSNPKVDIYATEIHILAENLSNAKHQKEELPSTVSAKAELTDMDITKPIIKDLHVVNWKDDKGHPLKLAWEGLVGAVAWVIKNHGKDQLATRAEFSGDLKDPNVNTWYIIGQLLRNGFIQALYPALENDININSVGDVKGGKMGKAYEGSKGPGAGKEEKKSRKEMRKEKKEEKKQQKKKQKSHH